ncbi:MAG: ATP-dependent DNA ligase [Candidatus Pacearchaeota archaeon]
MLYKKLAETYEALASTTKRLEKIKILSKFLTQVHELDKEVMYLLMGDIYPESDQRRIGISNQLAIKSIALAVGTDKNEVVKEWKNLGDLGQVAEKLKKKKKQSTLHEIALTTEKVLSNLRKLPELEGKGSINKKLALITELLTSASPIGSQYLVRTLIGDLRIGVQESTIREALCSAFFKGDKECSLKIQETIDKANDISEVFGIAKKGKLKDLEKVHLKIGKPIKAMLPKKVTSIKEGFKEVGCPCALEYKYDGFRMLIHKQDDKLIVFTRSLENVTNQFPEVVNYIKKYVKGKSFILDSEAVGYDKKTKEYTDFQKISQRIRRKYDIQKLQDELPVELNIFDILYHNGKSMLNEPFKKRTKLLRKIVTDKPYKIISSKQLITDDENKAEKFYKEALKNSQEGIMFKNLESPYRPGRRVGNMVKMKPEERDLDLVITGAEYGAGKRGGWMSSFIISCKHGEKYLEVGKVGIGIKEKSEAGEEDITFESLTNLLKPYITKEKGKSVEIKPKIVVAVTYQQIQKSPNYNSGWALRFPRFITLRPDKHISEVNTLDELKKDFANQKRNYVYG